MISIDGSYGEGGGQLLRTALSLAAITGKAFYVERIRARRPSPGLRSQHLTAVRAVAEICGAEVVGAELGSRALSFVPTMPPRAGDYRWDVGTAGATTLVLQAVLWPLASASAPSRLTLIGGTHVEWSPPVDYVQRVYLPVLSLAAGGDVALIEVEDWGWYPRGGGLLRAMIRGGVHLQALDLMERGSLRSVSVLSAASNLPDHIRCRQAERADFLLRKQGIKARTEVLSPPSPGQGTMVFVLAEYERAWAGFTSYGRMRKPAERVAEEACGGFVRYHGRVRPVDRCLADQLVLPLSLAGGQTRYAVASVTEHLLTNAWVVQQFLDVRIEIDGKVREAGIVRIACDESRIPCGRVR